MPMLPRRVVTQEAGFLARQEAVQVMRSKLEDHGMGLDMVLEKLKELMSATGWMDAPDNNTRMRAVLEILKLGGYRLEEPQPTYIQQNDNRQVVLQVRYGRDEQLERVTNEYDTKR